MHFHEYVSDVDGAYQAPFDQFPVADGYNVQDLLAPEEPPG